MTELIGETEKRDDYVKKKLEEGQLMIQLLQHQVLKLIPSNLIIAVDLYQDYKTNHKKICIHDNISILKTKYFLYTF